MNKRLLVSSIVILSHEKYIAYTGRGHICEYRISSRANELGYKQCSITLHDLQLISPVSFYIHNLYGTSF